MRNRTVPGKYTLGSWRSLRAENAQEVLEHEVIATEHLLVARCVYDEDSDFAEHTHDQEQITIVEDGRLEITVEGEALELGPGQMVSIFPKVSHASRVAGGGSARALNIFHNPQAGGNGLERVREAI